MRAFFDSEPDTWQDLELLVHQAFEEMGYEATRNQELETVRGRVRTDVYAVKRTTPIPTVIVCECKHWKKAVDQNVVYALRSVCSDVGCHFGLIISKVGFQSGAHETREATNVHLLDFAAFQSTFYSEWKTGIFMRIAALAEPLQPLLYNRFVGKDPELAARIKGVDVFKKYAVFFGEQRYTDFFIEDQPFPVRTFDPRGDPRVLEEVSIATPRQFYELCAAGAADARRQLGV